jgi:SAM-dependent methyltransferase
MSWQHGEIYESYVGRWSRLVAREFVTRLAMAPGLRWLDVGCGTGALTSAVLAGAEPAEVVGVDPSPGFLGYAATHVPDPRAHFAVGDARALPLAGASVDVVVSGLSLNFVPDPAAGLAESARVVRPGGTVAAYVWDYPGEMQLMRRFWDTAAELDPAAGPLREAALFDFCRPGPLQELFAGAGLADATVEAIVIPTVFAGFDDYWTPYLGGQGPAGAYTVSLDARQRDALREALRERLPRNDDGTIRLTARAWAVRSTLR